MKDHERERGRERERESITLRWSTKRNYNVHRSEPVYIFKVFLHTTHLVLTFFLYTFPTGMNILVYYFLYIIDIMWLMHS